jgi:hypothetical protein
MKYAIVNGIKTHARNVNSGAIGNDLWYPDYKVKARVGKYRQFWVYQDGKPKLPEGYEPESEWHSSWKESLKEEYVEVICGSKNEHRADVLTNEYAIEIQKSSICGFEVENRINFYKELTGQRVVWVVNVFEPWKDKRIKTFQSKNGKINQFEIKWSRGWSWVKDIAKNTDTHLFLDVGNKANNLLKVWNYKGGLLGAWYKKDKFFDEYLKSYAKQEFINDPQLFVDSLRLDINV